MYNTVRDNFLWSAIRASPFIYFIFGILNITINPSFDTYYYIIAYIFNFILNGLLKKSTQKIYNTLKTDYIYPFGKGSRPINATNCGTFSISNNPKSNSFGMPSGHSQLTWFFTTYFIFKILHNNNYINYNFIPINYNINIQILISISILIIISFLVSYSRVNIEGCHTQEQVIIGTIIGIISGLVIFNIEQYIKLLF